MHFQRLIGLMILIMFIGAACSDQEGSGVDGAAGMGGGSGGTGGSAGSSARKRIFYFRNGTLGKIRDSTEVRPALEVADEDCMRGASRMGLSGSWIAWLSSSQVDAIDRISDVGPWYRVDRETLLFPSKADFILGPKAPIDVTLDDPSSATDVLFWSGTAVDGRRTSENCLDWTVYNRPAVATVGRADVAGQAWVASDSLFCDAYLALLCIEQ